MIYYDKNKYEKHISEETVLNIERRMGIKCLFGGAFSTCVYGIDNKASDFDFCLIYDKNGTGMESFRYCDEEMCNDVVMLDWDYVTRSSDAYLKSIEKYPSALYRSDGKAHRCNLHRKDFTSNIIFQILYSDYIWDSGFLAGNRDKILDSISYLGTLDYHFTRAWGNFNNEFVKERGHAVKYLMAFLGYACMRWLMEHKTIPNMDIRFMFDQYMPERFSVFFNEALERQKNLEVDRDFRMHTFDVGTHNLFTVDPDEMDASTALKEKKMAYMDRNADVNCWMGQELHAMAGLLEAIANDRENIYIQGGKAAFLFKFFG